MYLPMETIYQAPERLIRCRQDMQIKRERIAKVSQSTLIRLLLDGIMCQPLEFDGPGNETEALYT